MKKSLFLLFSLLTLLPLGQSVYASHLTGVNMEFECLNACTTRVHVYSYRDCSPGSSTSIPSTAFSWQLVSGACGVNLPVPIGSWSVLSISEITPICPGLVTQCSNTGSSYFGVQQYYYYQDYEICSVSGCLFAGIFNLCCRNGAITSLSNPTGDGTYVQSTLNTSLATCNNSPVFREAPYFVTCAATASTVDQGADDLEGDSLVYSLGTCNSANGIPVSYNPGYSPTAPLGPSWNVTIDSQSGILTLVPTPGNIEIGVICIVVQEYRSGVLISTINRDMQLMVNPCNANNAANVSPISNLSAGNTATGYTINSNGSQVCFDIGVNDADAAQTKKIFWSMNDPGATFTDVTNVLITDTITGTNPVGHFCFTPPGTGTYYFYFTAEDDQCPYISSNVVQVTIIVNGAPCTPSVSISLVQDNCTSFTATANPVCGLTPPLTYAWTLTGGFTGNTVNFIHSFTTSGTYQYNLTVTDALGNTATDTETLNFNVAPPAVNITVGANCNTYTALANTSCGLIPPLTYAWTLTGGFTGNSATFVHSFANSGTYQYDVTVTDALGNTASDSDTLTFTIPPPVATNLITTTGFLNVCTGQCKTSTVNAGYVSYLWTNGDTTATTTFCDWLTDGMNYVHVTNAQGCMLYDSVNIAGQLPKIHGTITTSTGAPLANQQVLLIKYDTLAGGTLTLLSTNMTDSLGNYMICGIGDTLVYVKAIPDSATYPGEMPTYANAALLWANANGISSSSFPYLLNFSTLAGSNPGGPGFIGGTITSGANKVQDAGDPVSDLTLILVNEATGIAADITTTNANGYFSFANLAMGSYRIYTDKPHISLAPDSVPLVTITSTTPTLPNLNFVLHPTWLELLTPIAIDDPARATGMKLFPNPARDEIFFSSDQDFSSVQFELIDATGKMIHNWHKTNPSGNIRLDLSPLELPEGIYFFIVSADGNTFHFKVSLQR